MSYGSRFCEICHVSFTPPHRATALSTGDNHKRLCAQCRRATLDAMQSNSAPNDVATEHTTASPLKQVVFDLETWGLDRGWGVTLVASFMIHGYAVGTQTKTITLRDFAPWKAGKRSDDSEMAAAIFETLKGCHIAYAHNGERFDLRWLRTLALKYGLDMPRVKLVDPCMIAWRKYLLGRNSLEAVNSFLFPGEEQKMHISPEVWRHALMDNDDNAWASLAERCESDVAILNRISSRVTGDVGMIDYQGSWR